MKHIKSFSQKVNENQQNKKAYLVKLTDADGDVCVFLIDE